MIPILKLSSESDERQVGELLGKLRLNPEDLAGARGERAKANEDVQKILADVAARGDEAVVESARKFDDPNFTRAQIRVSAEEMKSAAGRLTPELTAALRRAIAQVREYQAHIMPRAPEPLKRPGVELGI